MEIIEIFDAARKGAESGTTGRKAAELLPLGACNGYLLEQAGMHFAQRPLMRLNKLLDHHHRQVNRKAWADLRQFSDALASTGQLKTVRQPVSPDLEITALCHRSLINNGPALLFESPRGFEMPVLGNLFGNEQRVLAALELEKRRDLFQLGRDLAFLQEPHLPEDRQSALDVVPGFARLAYVTPKQVDSAPWQEQMI